MAVKTVLVKSLLSVFQNADRKKKKRNGPHELRRSTDLVPLESPFRQWPVTYDPSRGETLRINVAYAGVILLDAA